jgi:hypothetical protein
MSGRLNKFDRIAMAGKNSSPSKSILNRLGIARD